MPPTRRVANGFALVLALCIAHAAAAVSLTLDAVTPQRAFQALGEAAGCRFVLTDDAAWVSEGVPVSVTLRDVTLWQAFQEVSRQTGYEPVFTPGDGVVTLRRVDVRAEQTPRPTRAAGPLLIRPRRAFVSRTAEQARLTLSPVRIAVEIEVFAEPEASAVYVAAVVPRASDGDGNELVRADDLDPLTGLAGGVGLLRMEFDAPAGLPTSVAAWQALLRVGIAEGRDELRLPLTGAPEGPTTRRGVVGPLEVLLDPPDMTTDAETGRQTAAVSLTLPRGRVDGLTWARAYNALAATPPELEGDAEPWRRTSYAVFAVGDPARPDETAIYRVLARFARDGGAGTESATLVWRLPRKIDEQRQGVRWQEPVPVEAARE